MPQENAPVLDWRDGDIPVARAFDDPYFSLDGGLAETAHVFLAGNGLPGRFRDGFHIAELGFGTGLNALAAWAAWDQPGRFRFTTFEAFPMALPDQARALRAFPELADKASALLDALADGEGPHDLGPMRLTVLRGDARQTLPQWTDPVDAWFLDGFSPAKNPELWGEPLLHHVADRLVPGGTLATYTAAGHVRRALASAGLEVQRIPGYGRKRHMTVARKPD
jgi:tRNA U34 5-methylaminomethyl-2-thiouridine-forming methyltransferase MnmC